MTFVVGDARVKGHHAVLVARSEFFRTILTSGFSEGQGATSSTTEIPIRDSTPGAFRLSGPSSAIFFYTDQLHFADESEVDP